MKSQLMSSLSMQTHKPNKCNQSYQNNPTTSPFTYRSITFKEFQNEERDESNGSFHLYSCSQLLINCICLLLLNCQQNESESVNEFSQ